VSNEPDLDFNLARRLRGSGLPSQPVLEINPHHPLVARLNHHLDDPRLSDWAHVLYNQAVLTFGARVDDPAAFVGRLNDLLVSLAGEDSGEVDDTTTESAAQAQADDHAEARADDGPKAQASDTDEAAADGE
jgi:molecular chaperone HtpG